MTRTLPLVVLVALLGAAVAVPAAQKPDPQTAPELAWWRESMKTHDRRIAWWREARFGMFIHWGVYSQLGGTWKGQPVSGYAEHIQRKMKIPIPVYREQVAGAFNPSKFDADEWVRLAKDAGMGYLIITAKHHDGFAMWDSKVNDYTVVRATPFKRDPMRELKAACDRHGLKFGFYYSHAFDWGSELAPGNDWDYDNPGGDRGLYGGRDWWNSAPSKYLENARKYVDTKALPQLRELIHDYHPDILWFDTPSKLPDSENLRIMKAVREADPNVVINGRLVRGLGDYDSTTDRPAEFTPHAGDWEGIPTTNESYGYNENDHSHKPPEHFVRLLARAAARGGNLLMNIGPRGDGTFDPKDVAILRGIARWMKGNRDSIRGTERTPLPVQAWGQSTRQGDRLYLHVFDSPADGKLVVGGLKSTPSRAYPLADPSKPALAVSRLNDLDVQVRLPSAAPDPADTVIVLEFDAAPATDPARLLSPSQPNRLHVFDGRLQGKGLKYGPGKKTDDWVEGFSQPGQAVVWPVRLNEAATFEVSVECDATAPGGAVEVVLGERTLRGTAKRGKNEVVSLGRTALPPGAFEIRLRPGEGNGDDLVRPRAVRLAPADGK
jgi:alpha-L-fucosidase